jgi:hypothetical protein
MTQEEYRLALLALTCIEKGACTRIETRREIIRDALYDVKSIQREIEEIQSDIKDCRSDRTVLSNWFHGSRIGNPPVLKSIYLTEAESRGE